MDTTAYFLHSRAPFILSFPAFSNFHEPATQATYLEKKEYIFPHPTENFSNSILHHILRVHQLNYRKNGTDSVATII